MDQLTPTSLNTAARLQKESSELSNASPSIPFLSVSKVLQLIKRTCLVWDCTRLRLVSRLLSSNSRTDQSAALYLPIVGKPSATVSVRPCAPGLKCHYSVKISGVCPVRMSADVRRPRALDAAAMNAAPTGGGKQKLLLRSSCHSSRSLKGTLRRAP